MDNRSHEEATSGGPSEVGTAWIHQEVMGKDIAKENGRE
jgi:hypothetical protein